MLSSSDGTSRVLLGVTAACVTAFGFTIRGIHSQTLVKIKLLEGIRSALKDEHITKELFDELKKAVIGSVARGMDNGHAKLSK